MAKMDYKQLKGIEDIQLNTDGSIVIKLNNKEQKITELSSTKIEFSKERLSQTQTAQMFNVTVQTIINWSKRGLIKKYKIGNSVFYLKSELLQAAQINNRLQQI